MSAIRLKHRVLLLHTLLPKRVLWWTRARVRSFADEDAFLEELLDELDDPASHP